jgi:hypothetical protein
MTALMRHQRQTEAGPIQRDPPFEFVAWQPDAGPR